MHVACNAVLGNYIEKPQLCNEALVCVPEAWLAADVQPLETKQVEDEEMVSAPDSADAIKVQCWDPRKAQEALKQRQVPELLSADSTHHREADKSAHGNMTSSHV